MDLVNYSQLVTPESEPEPEEQPINYFPDDNSTPTADSSSSDDE